MSERYWRSLFQEAWADTTKDLGFGSFRQGLKTALPPVALFAVAFVLVQQVVWAGTATLVLSALLVPPFFLHSLLKISRNRTQAAIGRVDEAEAKVAALEERIAVLTAPAPPPARDPDSIYQWDGVNVGRVVAARLDVGSGQAFFDSIFGVGEFNVHRPFEYREWLVEHFAHQQRTESRTDGVVTRAYHGVTCRILGRRPGA